MLLLLPGMDGTGRLFEPLLRALPAWLEARVVAYPTDEPQGYAELAPLVEGVVADGKEFVIVGESFSGPLALMLADRRPPGLRGVVLCASFVRFPLPALSPWLPALVRPWMFRFQPWGLAAWLLLGRHRHGELGPRLREAVQAVSPATMAARMRAMIEVDVRRKLRACPVPVLYLRAAEDWLVGPRCWDLVRRLRPDAEAVELPAPHLLLQTAPREAARVLASFRQRVAMECGTLQRDQP